VKEKQGLFYENHIAENLDKDHSYLYIDVGGGSTELSFSAMAYSLIKNHLILVPSVCLNKW
jgi:exopolyphosphatase/pppGpp-phosphohydrolase